MFLKQPTLVAHLISCGSEFHKVADEISISRFPYLTALLRLATREILDAERNTLVGVYQ